MIQFIPIFMPTGGGSGPPPTLKESIIFFIIVIYIALNLACFVKSFIDSDFYHRTCKFRKVYDFVFPAGYVGCQTYYFLNKDLTEEKN